MGAVDKEIHTCPYRWTMRSLSFALPAQLAALACLPAAGISASPSPTFAIVEKAVASDPGSTNSIVASALQPPHTITPAAASGVVAAAVRALGPRLGAKRVSGIVHTAVRLLPEHALEIVRAAVLAARAEYANDIVIAAVSAVPDPWKQVLYREVLQTQHGDRDFKGEPDHKAIVESESQVGGLPMTLAEAIVQTALAARPGLSRTGMIIAVEGVLQSAPGVLIGSISDPRGISGVGDAGNNNYANEPRRRNPPSLPPSPGAGGNVSVVSVRIPSTPAPVSP